MASSKAQKYGRRQTSRGPNLEVLPDGSDELAVNPLIALDELAKSEFPETTQFSAATAILMQAEPKLAGDTRRDAAAAAAMPDYAYLWKIDLQSAYRYRHNHPPELWVYGKQRNGRGYLDCRTQFGDASMIYGARLFTFYSFLSLASPPSARRRRATPSTVR